MDKYTIRQLLLLLITSVILLFTGNHLTTIGKLNSLSDGLVVMVFFTCFFPFLSLTLVFIGRLFKSLIRLV